MRKDLLDLLAERRIAHPSVLAEVSISARTLRFRVSGFPWWRDNPAANDIASIVFIFSGVEKGEFQAADIFREDDGWDNECLEGFSVSLARDVLWMGVGAVEIHGYSPLTDPLELYAALSDGLSDAGSFRCAGAFLNMGHSGTFREFRRIVDSNAYLLGRMPEAIEALVCASLDRQGVRYRKEKIRQRDNGFLVCFGGSYFTCETAIAEFD